jgi:hypothetical protein
MRFQSASKVSTQTNHWLTSEASESSMISELKDIRSSMEPLTIGSQIQKYLENTDG